MNKLGNQRLKNIIQEQRRQLQQVGKFLDMLWIDHGCSKYFRTELAKARCEICDIKYDCSTVDDPEECLRAFGDEAAKNIMLTLSGKKTI